MTDQAVGGLQQVIKADTQANFLNHLNIYQPKNVQMEDNQLMPYLVGVLLIDIVLDSNSAIFREVFG